MRRHVYIAVYSSIQQYLRVEEREAHDFASFFLSFPTLFFFSSIQQYLRVEEREAHDFASELEVGDVCVVER